MRQLRSDKIFGVFLLLLLATHFPYFVIDGTSEDLETYGLLVAILFELPFAVFVLWPWRTQDFTARESFFWKTLSVAYVGWWVVNMMFLLWPLEFWSSTADVLTDGIFLCFYICWMVALNARPDLSHGREFSLQDRHFLVAAMIVLATALFFYFVLIPSRLTPDLYDSWVPSLMFFTGIDFILVLWLVNLAMIARVWRWRMLFALLTTAHFLYSILDFLEAVKYGWVYDWANHPASNMLWTLPLIFIVMAARARGFDYKKEVAEDESGTSTGSVLKTRISPVIMMSFILPVLHIVLDQFGMIEDVMRGPQAAVILISLVIFWILAIQENIALRVASSRARDQAAELEQLRVQQAIAERTDMIKSRFLANVSHEVRTPMNGILGMSEILLRGSLEEEQREQAKLIMTSSREMIRVLDDILDYSRIESGDISIVNEPFRLDRLSESVMDLYASTRSSARLKMNLLIENDVPLDLEGDPSRLRQVLVNLVSNALKFTEKGEIRLDISLRDLSDSRATILFKVSDSGVGFESELIENLFQPFTQADDSRSRKHGGSGLGLAISKQIVEAQGGTIGAYQRPGGGAIFWFEVPFGRSTPVADSPAEPNFELVESLSEKNILLAEDDEINARVALKQLELLGYRADVAKDGNEALEALEKGSYDLVLMDCQMPVMDGMQATQKIRERGYSASQLPVIALTANAFDEDREACVECGMNDFIAKPAQLETLRTILSKWL